MTRTFMCSSTQKRQLRRTLWKALGRRLSASSRGRHTPTAHIQPGLLRRLVARLITAAVPKNASGNNASVR